ncbi:MAG: hypothetical protein R6W77_13360 [Trueperaceae bacterium]
MNLMASVAERLRRPDMIQVLVAVFAALAFVLAVRWPSGGSTVNEAWFSLAPARSALLAVIAAGFGAMMGAASRPRPSRDTDEPRPEWSAEAIATLGAIMALALITTPFETATHAASFPSVNVVWSLASPLLTVTAFYGLGMALGWVGRVLHVSMLIPVLVLGALALAAWVDIGIGRTVFNPWSAAIGVALPYLAVTLTASLATVAALARAARKGAGARGATP